MKHAGKDALEKLEPLLRELRSEKFLKEKSRGVFYRAGRAFLHFHEHGQLLFADVRFGADFERLAATTVAERKSLIARVRRLRSDGKARKPR